MSYRVKIIVSSLIGVFLPLFVVGMCSAVTNEMPNQDNFNGTPETNLVVANYDSASGYKLDAQVSTVKLYVKNRVGFIGVYHGGHCPGETTYDTASSGSLSTLYFIYRTSNNPTTHTESRDAMKATGGAGGFGGYTNAQFGCTAQGWMVMSYDLGFMADGVTPWPTSEQYPGYYAIEFQAQLVSPTVGGWNSFRIRGASGDFSSYYSGTTEKFALKQAGNLSPGTAQNYKLEFATPCALGSGSRSASLLWYDADVGQTNQPGGNIDTQLVTKNRLTGAVINISTITVSTGDAKPGSAPITVDGNYIYEWTWPNVYSANGIQFKLPYDSINYYNKCAPDIVRFDIDCSKAEFMVKNQDGADYNIQLIVDGVNETQFTGIPSGDPKDIFSTDTNKWRDFSSHSFTIKATNSVTGSNTTSAPRTVGPCLRLKCGQVTTSPASPQPNQTFTATASFSVIYPDGTATTVGSRGDSSTWYIRLRIVGVLDTAEQIGAPVLAPGGGSIQATRSNLTAGLGGHDAFWSVSTTSGGAVVTPPGVCNDQGSVSVYSMPYVRLYGGDSKAGAGFAAAGGACSSNTSRFIGFNNGSGTPQYSGAGSQLGLMATGQNQDFVSAAVRPGSSPLPKNFTFANIGSTDAGSVFGGGLGQAYLPCIKNYFAGFGTPVSSPGTISGALAPGTSYYSGTTKISGSLAAGVRRTIYVDGDVYIDKPITYIPNSYGSESDIPRFTLIARGNIYIDPFVPNLDGTYIAQPLSGGAKGFIYTCSTGAIPNGLFIVSSCNTKLTVNGSLIANAIKLARVNGTVGNATRDEYVNGDQNLAAEQIRFSPEMWIKPGVPTGPVQYDSIKSLPPVL